MSPSANSCRSPPLSFLRCGPSNRTFAALAKNGAVEFTLCGTSQLSPRQTQRQHSADCDCHEQDQGRIPVFYSEAVEAVPTPEIRFTGLPARDGSSHFSTEAWKASQSMWAIEGVKSSGWAITRGDRHAGYRGAGLEGVYAIAAERGLDGRVWPRVCELARCVELLFLMLVAVAK